MRITVIGADGQLGSDLLRQAALSGHSPLALTHADIEVTDPASVRAALAKAAPEVIVNCAALHHVDRCEDEPEAAFQVNTIGALRVARAARELGAKSIYVSTDYVFDGAKAEPYVETDLPGPLNVYGASKLAGEHTSRLADPRALVVRVAGLYGRTGPRGKGMNFIQRVLDMARRGVPVRGVADQTMTCTYTWDAADAILALAGKDARGIVHVVNEGALTWHDLAVHALKCAGLGDTPVEPVAASAFPGKAARPMSSALAAQRIRDITGAPMRPWRDAVAAYVSETQNIESRDDPLPAG